MIATEHLSSVSAITFDFGNTLVPVGRADLAAVVEQMTAATIDRCGPFDPGLFRQAWDEERDRQFAEDVPELREVDLDRRMVRVLARLRGMPLPAAGERWDDLLAVGWSSPDEIAFAVGAYSDAFVAIVPHPATIRPMLERLASRYRLAILSNWPLAATIDAYAEAAGWTPYLVAIVVSQRVGVIKPDPRIFRAAELALDRPGPLILHVGDDWAADIIGAIDAGWRAAYLRDRQSGSPLPRSDPDASVQPDLAIDDLSELEAILGDGRRGPG